LLLELLALELGGFVFAATQQSQAQNLTDLDAAYAAYRGLRQPVVFADYREALVELLRLGEERPTTVIIDEFPYLLSIWTTRCAASAACSGSLSRSSGCTS
jgi:uncharacterized protein